MPKSNSIEQEIFILGWIEKEPVDALNQAFHEAFHAKFGGARHECLWGAQTVYKAQKILARLADQGRISRGRVSPGQWQPGFPKSVMGYSKLRPVAGIA